MSPDRLATIMAKFDLLQVDVALIFGVTPRTVNNWYHGRQDAPRAVALILRALDEGVVPIEWIATQTKN